MPERECNLEFFERFQKEGSKGRLQKKTGLSGNYSQRGGGGGGGEGFIQFFLLAKIFLRYFGHYGTTALRQYSTTVLRHYGSMALHGTTVLWHYGTTVLQGLSE